MRRWRPVPIPCKSHLSGSHRSCIVRWRREPLRSLNHKVFEVRSNSFYQNNPANGTCTRKKKKKEIKSKHEQSSKLRIRNRAWQYLKYVNVIDPHAFHALLHGCYDILAGWNHAPEYTPLGRADHSLGICERSSKLALR